MCTIISQQSCIFSPQILSSEKGVSSTKSIYLTIEYRLNVPFCFRQRSVILSLLMHQHCNFASNIYLLILQLFEIHCHGLTYLTSTYKIKLWTRWRHHNSDKDAIRSMIEIRNVKRETIDGLQVEYS